MGPALAIGDAGELRVKPRHQLTVAWVIRVGGQQHDAAGKIDDVIFIAQAAQAIYRDAVILLAQAATHQRTEAMEEPALVPGRAFLGRAVEDLVVQTDIMGDQAWKFGRFLESPFGDAPHMLGQRR